MRVDHKWHTAGKTVEYSCGCLASASRAKLHSQIGSREIITILRLINVSRYLNARAGATFENSGGEALLVVTCMHSANENQKTVFVLREWRAKPSFEQAMAKLSRGKQAKAANDKGVLRQAEPFPCSCALRYFRREGQERDPAHQGTRLITIPFARKRDRVVGVNDDTDTVLKHRRIARICSDRYFASL